MTQSVIGLCFTFHTAVFVCLFVCFPAVSLFKHNVLNVFDVFDELEMPSRWSDIYFTPSTIAPAVFRQRYRIIVEVGYSIRSRLAVRHSIYCRKITRSNCRRCFFFIMMKIGWRYEWHLCVTLLYTIITCMFVYGIILSLSFISVSVIQMTFIPL